MNIHTSPLPPSLRLWDRLLHGGGLLRVKKVGLRLERWHFLLRLRLRQLRLRLLLLWVLHCAQVTHRVELILCHVTESTGIRSRNSGRTSCNLRRRGGRRRRPTRGDIGDIALMPLDVWEQFSTSKEAVFRQNLVTAKNSICEQDMVWLVIPRVVRQIAF